MDTLPPCSSSVPLSTLLFWGALPEMVLKCNKNAHTEKNNEATGSSCIQKTLSYSFLIYFQLLLIILNLQQKQQQKLCCEYKEILYCKNVKHP